MSEEECFLQALFPKTQNKHKWFEFGKDENGSDLPKTIISQEYSSEWKLGERAVLSGQ